MPRKLDSIEKIEAVVAVQREKRVEKVAKNKRDSRKYGRTVKTRPEFKRAKPTPVPKGKTVAEIEAMDPQDKAFRHPAGRPRKYPFDDPNFDPSTLPWKQRLRYDEQVKMNEKRALLRKFDATVVAAQAEVLGVHQKTPNGKAEGELVAARILDLDEWDDEELARGYRRNRQGRWGRPPKFVPREVQQEAFRRLVKRHTVKIQSAFIDATEQLVDLATHADSEKVRLDAVREIFDRILGRVPDTVRVQQDAPWQEFLVDALEPFPEVHIPRSVIESGDPVDAPQGRLAAASTPQAAPGSPDNPDESKLRLIVDLDKDE